MENQIKHPESETNEIGVTPDPTPAVEPAESDTQRLISAIQYIDLDELKPHPRNAEIYGNSPDAELLNNIRANGIIQPLLATWERVLLGGHRRLACAKLAGLTQVPVVFTDSTDEHDMLELLLDGNVQRRKSEDAIFQEVQLLREIESIKARRRQATAVQGKVGGESLPAASPEGVGDVRKIVARKLGIGEKKVDEVGKVATMINSLMESGKNEAAEELRETVRTQSIHAAAKQVKEVDPRRATRRKNRSVAQSMEVAKLTKEIRKRITRGLDRWPLERLRKFAQVVAALRKDWETENPVVEQESLTKMAA